MAAATLLVEVVTEELPPKALKRLGEAFAEGIASGLRRDGFLSANSETMPYATPRRLAVSITSVASVAPDSEIIDKLMPAKVAWDAASQPSEAYKKKLSGLGREHLATSSRDVRDGPDRVYVASDGKADYVYLRRIAKGQSLERGLQERLDEALASLPIPKVMTYQRPDGTTVKFVRPAHRLVALHGSRVMGVSALGLEAGNTTSGHRFLGRKDIDVESADAYEPALEAHGHVIPSFAKRRAAIVAALERASEHAHVLMPDALLDEVTALVEWPSVYAGSFERAFLDVPQECLVLTMQQNQKYFALADQAGKLKHRFLLVSNLSADDPSGIVHGNERVLRARLADAKFFYDQDRKLKLEARLPRLASVVYHNKLGTQLDRVKRIRAISAEIARLTRADAALTDRAAMLAKADLLTEMVGEFPELQGTIGRYYALHDGEPAAVADAIAQHYWPRFAGDALPQGQAATSVALADKLEALAGMFGIGQVPSGDKDPFGLRRNALGIVRILVEGRQRVSLGRLVDVAFASFDSAPGVAQAREALLDFIYERLRGYLRDLGSTANQVAAVIDSHPDLIDDLPARLEAVRLFETLPEAQALSAANKRIVNILKKSESESAAAVDRSLLADGAEHELYVTFQKLEPTVAAACAEGGYAGALKALAVTKPAVDRFFDDVLVMAEDRAVRANRLALLRGVAQTMNRVADISKLAM
ncbi:MAG TPA: glycine--tRNA ligase subunit beta [Casimicrobiaceae bacterium]|nr:glycine--tRNA ligase subunit beta [Casimicrobiaceae bacterium]